MHTQTLLKQQEREASNGSITHAHTLLNLPHSLLQKLCDSPFKLTSIRKQAMVLKPTY